MRMLGRRLQMLILAMSRTGRRMPYADALIILISMKRGFRHDEGDAAFWARAHFSRA